MDNLTHESTIVSIGGIDVRPFRDYESEILHLRMERDALYEALQKITQFTDEYASSDIFDEVIEQARKAMRMMK